MVGVGSRQASAGASCPFSIDFAGLPAGTILAEQYADFGVHISGVANAGGPNALIVFDTDAPPTHDPDLAVNVGNIAIFPTNLDDTNGDGLVDDPDENNFGGTATFAFDHEVSIGSVLWIDKDASHDNFVIAYNAAGDVIVSVPVPQAANASVQTIEINADGVRRLVFDYQESGGFGGIEVDCEQATAPPTDTPVVETPTPTPPATPTPTQAGETATPTPEATATPSPTPSAGTSTDAAPTDTPAPSPTVAAAVEPPAADTSVAAGPDALPAGGGPLPDERNALRWVGALAVLGLVLGGSVRSMRRQSR
jgi:hypothetical protein